ncbi:MAG: thymidine phosphorylase [Fuerstiella sp.]
MIPAEIIEAKRDGGILSDAQIEFFVQGFAEERIPDYQMSALAMAIFLKGMTTEETASLTHQMLNSGTRLAWPDFDGSIVDKHSTGGVGDKVSLPLAPLLAVLGMSVPMLSGRGLGATGGTLDKLESIPGYRTDLSLHEIQSLTKSVGCVITGASQELAPADRKLYALRDVTATVPSIPLITASIMSKKLAESPDALVLDVKFGSGAFMKTQQQATELARSLVNTGAAMSVKTTALLTDMNQPLGQMIGNSVEVLESIDTLKGVGPADVRQLTLQQAAELLVMTGLAADKPSALKTATEKLDDGSAYEKYAQMVEAQSGDPSAKLHVAAASLLSSGNAGYVTSVDTHAIGMSVIAMGGGRQQMTDAVDHSVGMKLLVKVGDSVEVGQPLVELFSNAPEAVSSQILNAIQITDQVTPPLPLIVDRIT